MQSACGGFSYLTNFIADGINQNILYGFFFHFSFILNAVTAVDRHQFPMTQNCNEIKKR